MWTSDLATWQKWLSRYSAALHAREADMHKAGLAALDDFVWSELPSLARARRPPHLLPAEYARVVRWKLRRGKFRPRLLAFAEAVQAVDVRCASIDAFASLRKAKENGYAAADMTKAIQALVSLKGCGPATASAILAAADPMVPFMSDELLYATVGRENKKYTLSAYMQLLKTVQTKAADLSAEHAEHVWTARDVERAVFASFHYVETHTHPPTHTPTHTAQPKSPDAGSTKSHQTNRTASIPALNPQTPAPRADPPAPVPHVKEEPDPERAVTPNSVQPLPQPLPQSLPQPLPPPLPPPPPLDATKTRVTARANEIVGLNAYDQPAAPAVATKPVVQEVHHENSAKAEEHKKGPSSLPANGSEQANNAAPTKDRTVQGTWETRRKTRSAAKAALDSSADGKALRRSKRKRGS